MTMRRQPPPPSQPWPRSAFPSTHLRAHPARQPLVLAPRRIVPHQPVQVSHLVNPPRRHPTRKHRLRLRRSPLVLSQVHLVLLALSQALVREQLRLSVGSHHLLRLDHSLLPLLRLLSRSARHHLRSAPPRLLQILSRSAVQLHLLLDRRELRFVLCFSVLPSRRSELRITAATPLHSEVALPRVLPVQGSRSVRLARLHLYSVVRSEHRLWHKQCRLLGEMAHIILRLFDPELTRSASLGLTDLYSGGTASPFGTTTPNGSATGFNFGAPAAAAGSTTPGGSPFQFGAATSSTPFAGFGAGATTGGPAFGASLPGTPTGATTPGGTAVAGGGLFNIGAGGDESPNKRKIAPLRRVRK